MYKVKTCGNDDQVLSTFRIIIVTSSTAMLCQATAALLLLVYIWATCLYATSPCCHIYRSPAKTFPILYNICSIQHLGKVKLKLKWNFLSRKIAKSSLRSKQYQSTILLQYVENCHQKDCEIFLTNFYIIYLLKYQPL